MNDVAAVPIVAAPPFAPGVYYGMPAADYHACEALSASGGRKLRQSPLHYKLARDTPNEPTPAMQFGTVVHAGVLEPDTLAQVCVVVPDNAPKRPTSAQLNAKKPAPETLDQIAYWGDFDAKSAGRIVLSADDHARALACVAAVRAHPGAARLLAGARTEVSLFWDDAQYKVPCKCRWDGLNRGGGFDLKTTQDASPETFARTIATYEYHAQAAHYISGAEHVLNESPRFFAFIAAESEPPHAVACYALPSNAILAGQHLVAIALERYAEAVASGKWRGYSDTIDTIELPKWALRFS